MCAYVCTPRGDIFNDFWQASCLRLSGNKSHLQRCTNYVFIDFIIKYKSILNFVTCSVEIFMNFYFDNLSIQPQESEVLSIIRYRGTSKIAGQLQKNTRSAIRECQQSWALGMRQHFNTQNRHGPNPEYNCVILVFVTPRMSTRLVKSMK